STTPWTRPAWRRYRASKAAVSPPAAACARAWSPSRASVAGACGLSVMAASSIPSRMQRRGTGFKPAGRRGVKWPFEPAIPEPAVTDIRQEDFIQSVADALQYISYYHPVDYIRNLAAAYEREESPAAKDAMA